MSKKHLEQEANELRPGHVFTIIDGREIVFMEDMIMELRMKRKLKSNEVVIHRNGDPLDNRDSNLALYEIGVD